MTDIWRPEEAQFWLLKSENLIYIIFLFLFHVINFTLSYNLALNIFFILIISCIFSIPGRRTSTAGACPEGGGGGLEIWLATPLSYSIERRDLSMKQLFDESVKC